MSRSILTTPLINDSFVPPEIASKRELPHPIPEGTKHGLLTATKEFELRSRPDGRNRCYQKFVCDCGNALFLVGYSVRNSNTRSCGCIHSAMIRSRMTTHGESQTKLYLSMIRNKRRAQKRNSKTEQILKEDLDTILQEFKNQCWICLVELDVVQWDHVHPLSKDGAHVRSNLRPACKHCNSRKGSIHPFTDEMKTRIANEVRALRTPQGHTIPDTDGLEVIAHVIP